MILRILFLTLLLLNISYASFQKVRIGKIDDYYKDKISEYELRNIIDEIEYTFESELNMNIFDYSKNGKDINFIYLPPSKLEKQITYKMSKLEIKKERILNLKNSLPVKIKKIASLKKRYKRENNLHSKNVKVFNDYIYKINKKKKISRDEYTKIKNYEKSQKIKFSKEIKRLNKERKSLQRDINSFNEKVKLYNNLIREYNRENNTLEGMIRSHRKVKGRTFGLQEIRLKTSYKDGKRIKERSVKTSMNKIEIYGFTNLKELKTILAHEIAHLVGIPHINVKNALMNPILQKKQLKKLSLTREDIKAFKEYF